MLNLNIRQIEMLSLVVNEGVVDAHDFTAIFSISARTCQLDVATINDELQRNGFMLEIINKRNKGYMISEAADPKDMDIIRRQSNAYLESSIIRYASKNPRVPTILRYLLMQEDFIRSEDLAGELHISLATLTGDLRMVRKRLESYHIKINSVPHYGMEVVAEGMQRLNALIDFCDWYDTETDALFPQISLIQYGISQDEVERSSQILKSVLNNSSYRLTENGFRRVLILICLLKKPMFRDLNLNRMIDLNELEEYEIARELTAYFNLNSTQHLWVITYYLIAFRESYGVEKAYLGRSIRFQAEAIFKVLYQGMKEESNIDLKENDALHQVLLNFIIRLVVRVTYQITEYDVRADLITITDRMPAAKAFARKILDYSFKKLLKYYNESSLYELTIIFYNFAYLTRSQYRQVNILLVSDTGLYSMLSVMRRLDFDRYNVHYSLINAYELKEQDLSKYDCIISSSKLIDSESITIPYFEMEYFKHGRQIEEIWNRFLMNLRQSEDILQQFEYIERFDLDENEENTVDGMISVVEDYGLNLRNQKTLIEDAIIKPDGWNWYKPFKTVVLLGTFQHPCHVFYFSLKKPPHQNKLMKGILLILLNPHHRLLSIKQADATIRRIEKKL